MIVNFLVDVLSSVIGFFPPITFPLDMISALAEVTSWVAVVNYYIPFDIFVGCLGMYFVAWIACALVSAVLQLL